MEVHPQMGWQLKQLPLPGLLSVFVQRDGTQHEKQNRSLIFLQGNAVWENQLY